MTTRSDLKVELALLALLALLWGSSYLFLKVAVTEIPPITLIAMRVAGATTFLLVLMHVRNERLPRDAGTWRMLYLQAIFNSIGSWTVLAWGQQYVDASLASVLNSTSPIFVFLFTALVTRHEPLGGRRLFGALVGFAGVVLIVGLDALHGLGTQVAGQLACLLGAALYACAAIYGKRFSHIPAVATATGTMICATATLVPLAFVVERPWAMHPSAIALAATAVPYYRCCAPVLPCCSTSASSTPSVRWVLPARVTCAPALA
jgi:drug/metabolite transporter (DMT)-like permease